MYTTGIDTKDLYIAAVASVGGFLASLGNLIHPVVAAAGLGLLGITIRVGWEGYKWYMTDGRRIHRLRKENRLLRARVKARHPRRGRRSPAEEDADIHTTEQ